METIYENTAYPELNIVKVSDTKITGNDLVCTDVRDGFFVKVAGAPLGKNKEVFISDELLKALHSMMLNRKD